MTVGLDVGDRYTHLCVLDAAGEVQEESRIPTRSEALQQRFASMAPARLVLEVGTHSPWMSRLLSKLGHEVLVANARRVRLIYAREFKHDRSDAECLARLGRLDPVLLAPVTHKGEQAQADLALLHTRDLLVRQRTGLLTHIRNTVKSLGGRLTSRSAGRLAQQGRAELPPLLVAVLEPLFAVLQLYNERIRAYDRQIEEVAAARSPETAQLRQIRGVGPITSLCFVLVVQDPTRFVSSRAVGPYLGLVPGCDQSGDTSHERRITKAGDPFLRRLLVHAAHYLLGPFGQDCDLRRWGLRLVERRGGAARGKKRAVTALARKLAVLMHRLWVTGEDYQPLRQAAATAG
jgi:transposase